MVGVPFLTEQLGAGARLAVEVAWGADITADPDGTGWTWTDISTDVRASGQVVIRTGRADEASITQPANLTLTLDNRAGLYSLGEQSPTWPDVRRNTPVRVRVDPDGVAGFSVLFQGGADGFTPDWDVTGTDATVALSASGVLRRLGQSAGPVQSSFRRSVTSGALTAVRAYWPCEEGEGASGFASAIDGASPLDFGGPPTFATNSTFACSLPLPALNGTVLTGQVPAYTSTGQIQVRLLIDVPSGGFDADSTIFSVTTSGSALFWRVLGNVAGALKVQAYTDVNTLIFDSGYVGFTLGGKAGQVGLQLTQVGSDVDWDLDFLELGALSSEGFAGTATGRTVGAATAIGIGGVGTNTALVVGHVLVQSAATSDTENRTQLNAYADELTTTARLDRLAAEGDLAMTVVDNADGTLVAQDVDMMGPQQPDRLLALLRACEMADGGVLYDGPGPGLTYVTRRRRYNADPVLTVDAATGELVMPFTPTDDDQRNLNRATATRSDGGSFTHTDTDGPLGVDAIGVYSGQITVNARTDRSLRHYAGWEVHKGTVGGYRYPTLTLDLAKDPGLIPAWLGVYLGERVDVTGLDTVREQHPEGAVSLLLEGHLQVLDRFRWNVTANLSPYQPHRVVRLAAASGDTNEHLLHLDTSGSTLAAGAAAGATSLSVTTTTGPLWTTTADDVPLQVEIEGIAVTVTAISGASSPQTFTVTGATVTKALPLGAAVTVWRPPALAI